MNIPLYNCAMRLGQFGIVSCHMSNLDLTLGWTLTQKGTLAFVIFDDVGKKLFDEEYHYTHGWLDFVPEDIDKAIYYTVNNAYSEIREAKAKNYAKLREALHLEPPCRGQ